MAIAESLMVATATVQRHISNMLAKSRTRNRAELVALGLSEGLGIDPKALGGGTFVVENAVIRVRVIQLVEEAVDALDGLEDGTIEADLAKHVIVPELRMAIGALELRAASIKDLLEARTRVKIAVGLLQRAAKVYEEHRVPFLVNVLATAAFELSKALLT